jgi:hypothetical protein
VVGSGYGDLIRKCWEWKVEAIGRNAKDQAKRMMEEMERSVHISEILKK